MRETDFPEFAALLDDTAALLMRAGQTLTATQRAMYFRSLQRHSIAEVRAALDAHIRDPQRGRFFPVPADVIAQLDGLAEADGRPGPEEAWAASLAARDEFDTVVWTAEMSQAWAAAKPVMDLGDEVGARMAYRETYTRLVEAARRARMPAEWSASEGFDASRRHVAIAAAVHSGRLPGSALLALPAPNVGEVLALEGPPSAAAEQARKALREIAASMRSQDAEAVSWDRAERNRTAALKAEAAARVANRQTVDGITT